MNKKDMLDILLYNIYEENSSNEIKNEKLKIIANEYNINIDDLYKRYVWLKNMNINPNFCHLEENHKLVYKIFDEYNKMLNENGIEYYYTSGILSYLLVNKELERYHHDLDVFVNMNDLEKLEKVCSKYNFSFERKLGNRTDDTQRIMLKMYCCDNPDIPITVFMYVREKDSSIIQKDYFIDEKGNRHVEYIYNSPSISKLSFSDIPNYHNNIRYYSITLEALFLCKTGNRPKDIYDCNIFSDDVDKEKLKELKEAFKHNFPNIIVNAKNDAFSEFIFEEQSKMKVLKKHD